MTHPTFDECTAPIMPSVQELPFRGPNPDNVRRFRLEGGDLTPKWGDNALTGDVAWCELSVHADGFVGAYGGTVWPAAWPDLFVTTSPSTVSGSGTTRLTPLGYKLLGLHVTVTPCEPSPDRRAKWLVRIDGKVAGSIRAFPTGLYTLDMAHAVAIYGTLEEATEMAVGYVEDSERETAQSAGTGEVQS